MESMHLSEIMDVGELKSAIAEGLVSQRHHSRLPISILNYTAKTQYSRAWNAVTMQCRGLIIDDGYSVVSRPFPKFFNLSEIDPSDNRLTHPFEVQEKLDGSLGIAWKYGDERGIATRGSFDSPQALVATDMLNSLNMQRYFLDHWTLLFEIIYPENKIVVDYGDRRELVLVACINKSTGLSLACDDTAMSSMPTAKFLGRNVPPQELIEKFGDKNAEGFVLTYRLPGEDFRVKVKLAEYVRLHKLVTGLSTKRIWEHLAAGRSINDLIDVVPDEFYYWVRTAIDDLRSNHTRKVSEIEAEFGRIYSPFRNVFAASAVKSENRAALFARYDGKDTDGIVWKMLEPSGSKSFRCNQEGDS